MKPIKIHNPILKLSSLPSLLEEGVKKSKEHAKMLEIPQSIIDTIRVDKNMYITKTWELEVFDLMTSIDDLPLVLVGGTGIGKTSVVNHISKLLGMKMFTFHLAQYNDISDFLGIVIPSEKGKTTFVWNKEWEEIFNLNKDYEENKKKNPKYIPPHSKRAVIFLDEYNRGNPSMLASVFSLLSDYRIKGIQLNPEVVRIIGSINPVGDYQVKYEDLAFKSRVCYYPVEADITRWKHWLKEEAKKYEIGFIEEFADAINIMGDGYFSRSESFEEYEGQSSPRAWTRLMNAYYHRKGLSEPMFIGTVGKEAKLKLEMFVQEKFKTMNKKTKKSSNAEEMYREMNKLFEEE